MKANFIKPVVLKSRVTAQFCTTFTEGSEANYEIRRFRLTQVANGAVIAFIA